MRNCLLFWGELMLTREQMAERTGMSVDTVDRWIEKKLLPAFRFGRSLRIREADAERFLEKRSTARGT